jgi:hypothetical protein
MLKTLNKTCFFDLKAKKDALKFIFFIALQKKLC